MWFSSAVNLFALSPCAVGLFSAKQEQEVNLLQKLHLIFSTKTAREQRLITQSELKLVRDWPAYFRYLNRLQLLMQRILVNDEVSDKRLISKLDGAMLQAILWRAAVLSRQDSSQDALGSYCNWPDAWLSVSPKSRALKMMRKRLSLLGLAAVSYWLGKNPDLWQPKACELKNWLIARLQRVRQADISDVQQEVRAEPAMALQQGLPNEGLPASSTVDLLAACDEALCSAEQKLELCQQPIS